MQRSLSHPETQRSLSAPDPELQAYPPTPDERRPISQFERDFSQMDAVVTYQARRALDSAQVFYFRSGTRCVEVEHAVRVSEYRDVAERGTERFAVGVAVYTYTPFPGHDDWPWAIDFRVGRDGIARAIMDPRRVCAFFLLPQRVTATALEFRVLSRNESCEQFVSVLGVWFRDAASCQSSLRP